MTVSTVGRQPNVAGWPAVYRFRAAAIGRASGRGIATRIVEAMGLAAAVPRAVFAGLRHATHRPGESVVANWGPAVVAGMRRGRYDLRSVWGQTVLVAGAVASAMVTKPRHGIAHAVTGMAGAAYRTSAAIGSRARQEATGLRRGASAVRSGFAVSWRRSVPEVRRQRSDLVGSWTRNVSAVESRTSVMTAALRRGVRGAGGDFGRLGARFAHSGATAVVAFQSLASGAAAGLGRGLRGTRASIAASWLGTVLAISSFVSVAMTGSRRGGRRARISVLAAGGRAAKALHTLTSAARAALRQGARRVGTSVAAGWARSVAAIRTAVAAAKTGLRRVVRGGRAGVAAGWRGAVSVVSTVTLSVLAGLRNAGRVMRTNLAALRQPRTPPLEGVAFEVVGGLHDGVRVMLESGIYRIGSTAEADIVLRDPGVMPGHAVLGVRRGNIRLEATGDDVGMGTRTVMRGHGCRLRLPIELSIGEACLRLSQAEAYSGGRSQLAIAGITVISVCVIALGALGFLRGEGLTFPAAGVGPSSTRVASSDPTAGLAGLLRREREQGVDPATLERARQELTAHVKDAKIRSLRINIAAHGLTVAGILGARDRAAWSDLQYWFDQTYGGRVGLTTNIIESKPPNLQLRAVWFGERPYVITVEGQHLNQGANLGDGWVIQEVTPDHVALAKDGEAQEVPYR
jgi:hypothetical protein